MSLKGLFRADGAAVILLGLVLGLQAQAQGPQLGGAKQADSSDPTAIRVVGGSVQSSSLLYVNDISKRIASRQETGPNGELALRVVPVVGQGGIHDIRDVLSRGSGVDMAVTHEHVIKHLDKTRELGELKGKLVYIAKLFFEEFHLIAGPDIRQISDLAGKPVNIGEYGSSVERLARDLFDELNISIKELHLEEADALNRVREGSVAATVVLASKPARLLERLPRESGLHLVPIVYNGEKIDTYLPSTLSSHDYPHLLATDDKIPTVVARTVLVAYNYPQGSRRYRLLQQFVDMFFPSILEHQAASQTSRGSEVISDELHGWTRFRPATRWLQNWQAEQRSAGVRGESAGSNALGKLETERLFKEFLEWRERRARP